MPFYLQIIRNCAVGWLLTVVFPNFEKLIPYIGSSCLLRNRNPADTVGEKFAGFRPDAFHRIETVKGIPRIQRETAQGKRRAFRLKIKQCIILLRSRRAVSPAAVANRPALLGVTSSLFGTNSR